MHVKCLVQDLIFLNTSIWFSGLWLGGKESAPQCRRCRFNPWVRKIAWRKKWQPTPVFLPGKFHGKRCLVCYTPWSHEDLDTTANTHTHIWSARLSEMLSHFTCAVTLPVLRSIAPAVWTLRSRRTAARQAPLSMVSSARILERVAMFSCRGSSQPSDWIQVRLTAGRFFTS